MILSNLSERGLQHISGLKLKDLDRTGWTEFEFHQRCSTIILQDESMPTGHFDYQVSTEWKAIIGDDYTRNCKHKTRCRHENTVCVQYSHKLPSSPPHLSRITPGMQCPTPVMSSAPTHRQTKKGIPPSTSQTPSSPSPREEDQERFDGDVSQIGQRRKRSTHTRPCRRQTLPANLVSSCWGTTKSLSRGGLRSSHLDWFPLDL